MSDDPFGLSAAEHQRQHTRLREVQNALQRADFIVHHLPPGEAGRTLHTLQVYESAASLLPVQLNLLPMGLEGLRFLQFYFLFPDDVQHPAKLGALLPLLSEAPPVGHVYLNHSQQLVHRYLFVSASFVPLPLDTIVRVMALFAAMALRFDTLLRGFVQGQYTLEEMAGLLYGQ